MNAINTAICLTGEWLIYILHVFWRHTNTGIRHTICEFNVAFFFAFFFFHINSDFTTWLSILNGVRKKIDIDLINSKLLSFDEVIPSENDENHDKALSLYQQAAEDGYFWAQYYYGLYLLFVGGEVMEKGVAYLEKALTHIPEVPEPDEDSVENDETREWLRENIETSLFKCTGRTSTHIIELEKNAQQHDLMACVELTIAYLEGNECQRDRDKAFDYASRLLFEDHEFDQLLIRMDDLPPTDRQWLEGKLAEEAGRIEAMNG